jgi:hypothetical protein
LNKEDDEMKIETWKKFLICAGTATQIVSYFAGSNSLLIIGGISIIVGTIAVALMN